MFPVIFQKHGRVIALAGFLGKAVRQQYAPVVEESRGNFGVKLLALAFKESTVFPKCEAAAAVLAEEAFCTLDDRIPAAGAFPNDGAAVPKEDFAAIDRRICTDQISDHFGNICVKALRRQLPALDLLEALFPFRGELG